MFSAFPVFNIEEHFGWHTGGNTKFCFAILFCANFSDWDFVRLWNKHQGSVTCFVFCIFFLWWTYTSYTFKCSQTNRTSNMLLRLHFLRTVPLLEISLARYSNGTLFWLVWKAMPRSKFSWWTSRLKPLWFTSISRISNSLFSIFDFFRNRKSSKWNENGRRTFRTKWDRNEAPWLVNKDDSSKIIFSKQSFTN